MRPRRCVRLGIAVVDGPIVDEDPHPPRGLGGVDLHDVRGVEGLSMGGTLATLLVQRNPEIAGLAVINPVFEIRNWKLRALTSSPST